MAKRRSLTKKEKLDRLHRRLVDERYEHERVWGDDESLAKVNKLKKQLKKLLNS